MTGDPRSTMRREHKKIRTGIAMRSTIILTLQLNGRTLTIVARGLSVLLLLQQHVRDCRLRDSLECAGKCRQPKPHSRFNVTR